MAYITFQPSDHFNTKLYTGNNSSSNAITGVGFQPDWVWLKARNYGESHRVYDVVRGVANYVTPNSTGAQSNSIPLTSFDSDGFTIGSSDGSVNGNYNYTSWNWKANGSGSSNSDGSITSTVSANTTSGVSIVKYTGNETGAPHTVGHGLGVKPKVIFIKRLNDSIDWIAYHSSLGATKNLRLNTNEQVDTSSAIFNDTEPTSSVFTIGTNHSVNHTGSNFIAYCFAEKKGFSKFGSYKGNNNSDGAFIYTGFKPAFIVCRFTGSGNGYDWIMYDNKRPNSTNPTPNILEANTADTENTTSSFNCDFLSNGFKFRGTESNVNGAQNYLYWAFAEEPIVSSNNIPATAR